MFATPVIYPLSEAKKKGVEWLVSVNPMSSVIETFRYGLLGNGTYNSAHLIYSFVFMVVFLLASIVIFNKVEKNFMDTV
jgi:lipopolysaccharide transport system permease protein